MIDPRFLQHRDELIGVAYRMLGSIADAEDAVQDALMRSEDAVDIESPRAWLITVLTRVCLDQLKSARKKRETYVGQWLPEPVRTDDPRAWLKPRTLEDIESLSLAFLVLLETLSPLERAAFLLHDVFDYPHAEIAHILEREQSSVRQLVSRARTHVRDGRPRFNADPDRHRALLAQFFSAIGSGEMHAIEALLADDASATSDGGGIVKAALNTIVGRAAIARFMRGVGTKLAAGAAFEMIELNGVPAALWRIDGVISGVLTIAFSDAGIHRIDMVLNPDKLRGVSEMRAVGTAPA